MIASLVAAGVCYAVFLLFETFALALDRLSPIKVRGLLEEHPERARILSKDPLHHVGIQALVHAKGPK